MFAITFVNAQETMYIYKDGSIIGQHELAQIDSIIFYKTAEGTITDIDGNVYQTVVIGTQNWMVENFKATKYNDGTNILEVSSPSEWSKLTTGAFCWNDNDKETFKVPYGALYNWYTIETNKLCPIGWHVPTLVEWNILINYLGGEQVAGGKLKESGSSHWGSNNKGTNESGFTAIPGGSRSDDNGNFGALGYFGFYWSSTVIDENSGKVIHLTLSAFDESATINDSREKGWGCSIRCIQD